MVDDADPSEPWLPVPVLLALSLGSAFAGALAAAALFESPAAAVDLLQRPMFYVIFAVAGGGGLLLAGSGWET